MRVKLGMDICSTVEIIFCDIYILWTSLLLDNSPKYWWRLELTVAGVTSGNCRNTWDNLFSFSHSFRMFSGFFGLFPSAPVLSLKHITSWRIILPQTLHLSSPWACVPVNDNVNYPTVLYSEAVEWLLFFW